MAGHATGLTHASPRCPERKTSTAPLRRATAPRPSRRRAGAGARPGAEAAPFVRSSASAAHRPCRAGGSAGSSAHLGGRATRFRRCRRRQRVATALTFVLTSPEHPYTHHLLAAVPARADNRAAYGSPTRYWSAPDGAPRPTRRRPNWTTWPRNSRSSSDDRPAERTLRRGQNRTGRLTGLPAAGAAGRTAGGGRVGSVFALAHRPPICRAHARQPCPARHHPRVPDGLPQKAVRHRLRLPQPDVARQALAGRPPASVGPSCHRWPLTHPAALTRASRDFALLGSAGAPLP
ncbi:hypothetical protein SAMN05446589_10339 [Streptomyces sp. OV198]|nr:hypothetical protein SAMN05446589_10339 [Streptomyces sp. OV198]